MNYKITIEGMHCQGCANLIKLNLEDAGFENVEVDAKTKEANFESDNEKEAVSKSLKNAFEDLKGYSYILI